MELASYPETVTARYFSSPATVLLRPATRAEWEAQAELKAPEPVATQRVHKIGFAVLSGETNEVLAEGMTYAEMFYWMRRKEATYWRRNISANDFEEPVEWDRVDRTYRRSPDNPLSVVTFVLAMTRPALHLQHGMALHFTQSTCQLDILSPHWEAFFDKEGWLMPFLALAGTTLTPQTLEETLQSQGFKKQGD